MATIDVINQAGAVVGSVELNDAVFGIEPHQQAMYDALVMQMASRRQGTADTKGRSEVSGGGRKPYRQKGTGRARQGSIRATQFRGGGTVFGPTPRSYAYRINKKVRRLALWIKLKLLNQKQNHSFQLLKLSKRLRKHCLLLLIAKKQQTFTYQHVTLQQLQ